MQEYDQRALTVTVIRELTLDPFGLSLHYLSIGGNLGFPPVRAYIQGSGLLPIRDRDMVSCAVNDLALEQPWRPRAPLSDAEPV
jgi:hypothetical protein